MQILEDPYLQLPQHGARRSKEGKWRTELALSPRSPQEHHICPGDSHRDIATKILLHECKRQIHSCSDSCGRKDVSVADEYGFGIHCDLRVFMSKLLAKIPVGCGTPPIQEARRREHESARAYGSNPSHSGCPCAEPVEHRFLAFRFPRIHSAGHQQGVDRTLN